MPLNIEDVLKQEGHRRDDMKTVIFLLALVIFAFSPISAFTNECPIVSKVEKGQYVILHVSGTYHGTLSGKVIEVSPNNCILGISTTTDYRTFYIDAERIAAIGVKPKR